MTEKLIPPDPNRCQVEWRDGSFMTFGPRHTVRCHKIPTVIAKEREKPHGEMSMCDEHMKIYQEKHPGTATFKRIVRSNQRGVGTIFHPCPVCGAKTNEPCRTPKGRRKETFHDTRPFSIAV